MANVAPTTVRLARVVHRTLLAGVLISAALLTIGLALALAGQVAEAEPVTDWYELAHRAAGGDGRAIVDLGLIVLMFTPVFRVLVLAIGWVAERKWRLALVSTAVAILLAASVAIGVG
jgi:uncharacterized membrane protein